MSENDALTDHEAAGEDAAEKPQSPMEQLDEIRARHAVDLTPLNGHADDIIRGISDGVRKVLEANIPILRPADEGIITVEETSELGLPRYASDDWLIDQMNLDAKRQVIENSPAILAIETADADEILAQASALYKDAQQLESYIRENVPQDSVEKDYAWLSKSIQEMMDAAFLLDGNARNLNAMFGRSEAKRNLVEARLHEMQIRSYLGDPRLDNVLSPGYGATPVGATFLPLHKVEDITLVPVKHDDHETRNLLKMAVSREPAFQIPGFLRSATVVETKTQPAYSPGMPKKSDKPGILKNLKNKLARSVSTIALAAAMRFEWFKPIEAPDAKTSRKPDPVVALYRRQLAARQALTSEELLNLERKPGFPAKGDIPGTDTANYTPEQRELSYWLSTILGDGSQSGHRTIEKVTRGLSQPGQDMWRDVTYQAMLDCAKTHIPTPARQKLRHAAHAYMKAIQLDQHELLEERLAALDEAALYYKFPLSASVVNRAASEDKARTLEIEANVARRAQNEDAAKLNQQEMVAYLAFRDALEKRKVANASTIATQLLADVPESRRDNFLFAMTYTYEDQEKTSEARAVRNQVRLIIDRVIKNSPKANNGLDEIAGTGARLQFSDAAYEPHSQEETQKILLWTLINDLEPTTRKLDHVSPELEQQFAKRNQHGAEQFQYLYRRIEAYHDAVLNNDRNPGYRHELTGLSSEIQGLSDDLLRDSEALTRSLQKNHPKALLEELKFVHETLNDIRQDITEVLDIEHEYLKAHFHEKMEENLITEEFVDLFSDAYNAHARHKREHADLGDKTLAVYIDTIATRGDADYVHQSVTEAMRGRKGAKSDLKKLMKALRLQASTELHEDEIRKAGHRLTPDDHDNRARTESALRMAVKKIVPHIDTDDTVPRSGKSAREQLGLSAEQIAAQDSTLADMRAALAPVQPELPGLDQPAEDLTVPALNTTPRPIEEIEPVYIPGPKLAETPTIVADALKLEAEKVHAVTQKAALEKAYAVVDSIGQTPAHADPLLLAAPDAQPLRPAPQLIDPQGHESTPVTGRTKRALLLDEPTSVLPQENVLPLSLAPKAGTPSLAEILRGNAKTFGFDAEGSDDDYPLLNDQETHPDEAGDEPAFVPTDSLAPAATTQIQPDRHAIAPNNLKRPLLVHEDPDLTAAPWQRTLPLSQAPKADHGTDPEFSGMAAPVATSTRSPVIRDRLTGAEIPADAPSRRLVAASPAPQDYPTRAEIDGQLALPADMQVEDQTDQNRDRSIDDAIPEDAPIRHIVSRGRASPALSAVADNLRDPIRDGAAQPETENTPTRRVSHLGRTPSRTEHPDNMLPNERLEAERQARLALPDTTDAKEPARRRVGDPIRPVAALEYPSAGEDTVITPEKKRWRDRAVAQFLRRWPTMVVGVGAGIGVSAIGIAMVPVLASVALAAFISGPYGYHYERSMAAIDARLGGEKLFARRIAEVGAAAAAVGAMVINLAVPIDYEEKRLDIRRQTLIAPLFSLAKTVTQYTRAYNAAAKEIKRLENHGMKLDAAQKRAVRQAKQKEYPVDDFSKTVTRSAIMGGIFGAAGYGLAESGILSHLYNAASQAFDSGMDAGSDLFRKLFPEPSSVTTADPTPSAQPLADPATFPQGTPESQIKSPQESLRDYFGPHNPVTEAAIRTMDSSGLTPEELALDKTIDQLSLQRHTAMGMEQSTAADTSMTAALLAPTSVQEFLAGDAMTSNVTFWQTEMSAGRVPEWARDAIQNALDGTAKGNIVAANDLLNITAEAGVWIDGDYHRMVNYQPNAEAVVIAKHQLIELDKLIDTRAMDTVGAQAERYIADVDVRVANAQIQAARAPKLTP